MISRIQKLYHLAEASNLPSILERGLMSTERLIDAAGIPDPERATRLRGHRAHNVRVSEQVLIRDQRPMPPSALAPALDDGLEPADWYALLNGFVFLWLDRERMQRQRRACGERPQVLLTFDGTVLLDRHRADAFVSPINSGNARRRPARRGRGTLIPYTSWLNEGWPTGRPGRPPVEFLFRCTIPAQAPQLIDISEI
jgi:hypothetical protein